MYRQPNETRKQLQIILYWDCWTSPQAEGQTLTIINDVPMDLHRLPPANRITVKRPANGSLGVFRCMCSCACLHAYLNSMHVTVLLLVMSYNENVERMLALTYHKKSANMSKFGGKCNLTTLQNSKPSKVQQRSPGYSQQRTGPELSVEGTKLKRNAAQTQTDVTMCFLHGPLLYVNLLYGQICLPSIRTCKISDA